ncbi:MAG: cyanophycinase [Bryobacteraceae bacterium]
MDRRLFVTAGLGAMLPSAGAAAPPVVGPAKGSLVVVGGGDLGPEIVSTFRELAGGDGARVVLIPTADESDHFESGWLDRHPLAKAGLAHLTLLHTRDREHADSPEFTRAIEHATGVWFGGGRQWRLVDSYLDTRTHRELFRLLDRGGVIGGTSAGATIQGSYLVRGAREGNHIMMAPGYETGMGFLRGVAVDQHLLARKRENDLVAVVERHRDLLGIGIDEGTAIVVRGDEFAVIGSSKVAIYDAARLPYYFLGHGARFDMGRRRVI